VALPYDDMPGMLHIDGVPPFEVGGHTGHTLYVRVENDDPCFAPSGHSVVQLLAPTSYEWWAKRGAGYLAAKDAVAAECQALLEPHFDGLAGAVRMTDVATPLTYWNTARSWRGAYEGWIPTEGSMFQHVQKTLPGLDHFYMAGQWVEPGGGVPMAIQSGRQVVQLMCEAAGREFVPKPH
jgi:phytoene dehydrogenase-like protein